MYAIFNVLLRITNKDLDYIQISKMLKTYNMLCQACTQAATMKNVDFCGVKKTNTSFYSYFSIQLIDKYENE